MACHEGHTELNSPTASTSFLIQNYRRQDVSFVRGNGCYLYDGAGREYLDAFAGVAVCTLGHSHPKLVETLSRQAATLIHTSNHYGQLGQEELAARIVPEAFPGRMLFCNSGTEANEAAYKLVRLWGNVAHEGRKRRIIAFEGSFHGRTLGSLSITHTPSYRAPFEPLPPTDFVPFGDADALAAAMKDDVAGVFLEPIQGESGVHVPPPGFLARVRELCTRHQALMVADEIQTGIGRTGRMFCHQHEGITPDVMSLAKGLGGGIPIGAVLATEPVAALMTPGLHGTTFGGNPFACAAGLTVMKEVTSPGFVGNVVERGLQLMEGLRRIFGPTHEVRGKGLLVGVQLQRPPAELVKAALAQGLVVGVAGNNTLRIAPSLIITAVQVDELLEKLAAAHRAQG
ncbi:acetylornithine transaminase [Vitiosangium sp. GDMCC 1.1324]|nr:acetylornithine transaminase [Vitiosangium sp. GDMCC 1.1324]